MLKIIVPVLASIVGLTACGVREKKDLPAPQIHAPYIIELPSYDGSPDYLLGIYDRNIRFENLSSDVREQIAASDVVVLEYHPDDWEAEATPNNFLLNSGDDLRSRLTLKAWMRLTSLFYGFHESLVDADLARMEPWWLINEFEKKLTDSRTNLNKEIFEFAKNQQKPVEYLETIYDHSAHLKNSFNYTDLEYAMIRFESVYARELRNIETAYVNGDHKKLAELINLFFNEKQKQAVSAQAERFKTQFEYFGSGRRAFYVIPIATALKVRLPNW